MSKIETIVDKLSKLTVLEAAGLAKLLEERWDNNPVSEEASIDQNLKAIVEELSKLTVSEASELAKALEESWGVSAAAPVAMAAAAPVAAVEEKTEFDVIIAGAGDKKLDVIKAVREIAPQLTLPQAKTLVESAPQKIKEGVSKEEAEKCKKVLEAAGAKVELK